MLKQLDEEVVLPLELLEAQSDIELIQSVLYDLDNVKKELYKVSDKLDEVQVGSTVNFTEKYVNYWLVLTNFNLLCVLWHCYVH